MADVDLQELELRASRFDTAAGMRQLRIAIAALLFLSMSTCIAKGANGPVNPSLVQAATIPPFEQIGFLITPAPPGPAPTAAPAEPGQPPPAPPPTVAPTAAALRCALLADTSLTRERNLNGLNDLGGYAAMVIDQGEAISTPFTPRAVGFATTIAFYDAEGDFIAAADVEPCAAQGGCPAIPPPSPYRYLVVSNRGELPAWGAGPGSTLEVGGPCPPPPVPPPPPAG